MEAWLAEVSFTFIEDGENGLPRLWHTSSTMSFPADEARCRVAESTSLLEMWEQKRRS